jgi:hypothetical protein
MSNQNLYMEDFLESFVWLFMDQSKDNINNNYLNFKPNYIFFLIKFLKLNFLITLSHLS